MNSLVTLRPEEIERFKKDPEYFDRVRHMLENSMNVSAFRLSYVLEVPLQMLIARCRRARVRMQSMHAFTQRDSTMQSDFQKMFRKLMEDKLATRPHIAEKRTSIISPSSPSLSLSLSFLPVKESESLTCIAVH